MQKPSSESGMTLVVILVVGAIAAILISITFRQLDNVNSAQRLLEQKSDLASLRMYVEAWTNCSKTDSTMGTCNYGSPVKIMKADNTALIDNVWATPTTHFKYQVRASCVACPSCSNGRKYLVEVFLPAKPKGPKSNSWVDLFQNGMSICQTN